MESLLTINGVKLIYHSKTTETLAVADLSFNVAKGQFVALIGPSGCGKTRILSLIAGLMPPSSGDIILNGKKVVRPDDKIGYMLQKDQLFPWLTIEDNVLLPLKIKKKLNDKTRKFAFDLIEKYKLKEFVKYYPKQLSGGMRQRVALIRTLSSCPELLLLDEPFSALDYQTRLSVCDDVFSIIKSENKTALLVTHDISEAISVADKIIVLSKRPTKVKAEHEIYFENAFTPLKRRENKKFSYWFEVLWRELNDG